jgi:hypothetical protein
MRSGRPLELEPIKPYPGFEKPVVHEIPPDLPDDNGKVQSTTLDGTRPKGRLILYTSAENMPTAFKKLKPRWKVTYRTQHQMVGSKSVGELVPGIPGSNYVYATVELSALEPDYVELGRIRPGSGPLMQALDRFVAEQTRELAKKINDCRKQEQDQSALDEVHEENRRLDNFKNRFLPVSEFGAYGSGNGEGPGSWPDTTREPIVYGDVPEAIEISWERGRTLRVAKSVHLNLGTILRPHIRDAQGHIVPGFQLEWCTGDPHVVTFPQGSTMTAVCKGRTEIWARIKNGTIESEKITVEVWQIDHVLLTPRNLEIPVGERKQIIAEVTSDDGQRSTDVFLNWKHDADDQLIVRIHPTGFVTGNRTGKTGITAGAGNPEASGVWARICAEVTVVPNPKELERGGGFPQLLLTERDIDPATGEKRPSNPDQPALWQEVTDYQYNVWWLNIGAPDAAFLFQQRDENSSLWRAFHAQKLVDMVVQVHMQQEFTRKGDSENKDYWASHKQSLEIFSVLLAEPMWRELRSYVQTGSGLN